LLAWLPLAGKPKPDRVGRGDALVHVPCTFANIFEVELDVINFRRGAIASGEVARSRLPRSGSAGGIAAGQQPNNHLAIARHKVALVPEGNRAEVRGTTRLTRASDLTGLALSGGGIRSASFGLGVLQALDSLTDHNEPHVLDAIDYMSTVSGGGYIGGSLIAGLMQADHSFPFDSRLDEQETPEVQHLRDYSNYLIPNGAIDYVVNATLVLRGLLANAIIILPILLLLATITLLFRPTVKDLSVASVFGFEVTKLPVPLLVIPGAETFTLGLNLLLVVAIVLFGSAIYTSVTFRSGTLHSRQILGRVLAYLLIAVFITVFLEAQPFVLSGMVGPPKNADLSALPEGTAREILAWLGSKLPALATVLVPIAVALVGTAQKLANLAKASLGEATWSAWIKKYSARIALYASGVVVPLLLWVAYLYFVYWGIRDDFSPGCGVYTPGWIAKLASCETSWTTTLPQWMGPLAERLGPTGLLYLGLSVVVTVICLFIGPNANSLHRLYRDRLSQAFLFPRSAGDPDPGLLKFSALKPRDKHGKWSLAAALAPYLLTNTAINLEASRELNKRGRNADTFIFSPLYVGSRGTQYVETTEFEKVMPDLALATAMAISGAAASANMGTSTKKILTFSLSLLNVRLGYWLANPARIGAFARRFYRLLANVGTWYFACETAGLLDERKLNVYLTDGGHIENLGIYELLRRRCKVILAVDAEADPDMTFPSFVALQILARIDLGVTIDLPWEALQKQALGVTSSALYGPAGPPGSKGPHAAVGTIHYGEEETGVLIYIKSSLSGDENDYILDYKRRNESFPHETTVDQFFNEEQFEVYRALGFHATRGLLTGADEFAKPPVVPSAWAQEVKKALLLLNVPPVMAEKLAARI
jgi:hypothetical protein